MATTAMQKITLEVPRDLLERAQEASGAGISETVRAGLQILAASDVYQRLRQMRGKVKLSVSWQELKDDR